jgi:hypothetical protein
MTSIRAAAVGAALVALLVANACGQVDAPGQGSQGSPGSPAPNAAGSGAGAAPPAAAAATPEPATIAELLPPGPGRDQLLNGCGSCHNLGCSLIGQRTAERWDSLKESHKEKVPDAAELEAVFAYVKTRFNDANPEPKVPAKFLQGGCTPF